MVRGTETASTLIELRPARPLVASRGRNSCLLLPRPRASVGGLYRTSAFRRTREPVELLRGIREGAHAERNRATSSRCFFYHGLSAHGGGDGGKHCQSGEVSWASTLYPAFVDLQGLEIVG